MKKVAFIQTGIALLVLGLFLSLPFQGFSQVTIEIQVSPSTLNLQNQGQVVTVHTDIAYGAVQASSVELNGLSIDHWKADNQGNFVAKFLMEEVIELAENLNIGELNTLTLTGTTTAGETFTGADEVMIINVIPQGTGKK